MIYDAVVSYAGEEAERLAEVVGHLEGAGFTVWADRAMLPAGSMHRAAILAAIDRSAVFVFLDSPFWRDSENCQAELRHATSNGMRIVAVGSGPTATDQSVAARVVDGDEEALRGALATGLEVSRAQARFRVAPVPADARVISQGPLDSLGISIGEEMREAMERVRSSDRRRQRLNSSAIAAVLLAAVLLAALAVQARMAAEDDERQSVRAARHVESAAAAAASEGSRDTYAKLALARRAVSLEQGPVAIDALRDAVRSFGEGVTLTGFAPSAVAGVAVSDDGRNAAIVDAAGGITLALVGARATRRVLSAEAADASSVIALTPGGSILAAVRKEGGSVEVVDTGDGDLVPVAGTKDVAALIPLSERRLVAVRHDGLVLGFDPGLAQPKASQIARVRGPVRAATLASRGSDGEFGLATLTDGAVEVTEVGGDGPPWRAPLPVDQDDYAPGWEFIRACGDRLSVIATDLAGSTSFAIPITVDRVGRAARTLSMIHSAGLACLPEGGAVASDFPRGELAFPAGTPSLPGFTEGSDGGTRYAVSSSASGAWAAAAGSDGTLRLLRAENFGRELEVDDLEEIIPGDPAPIALVEGRLGAVEGGRVDPISRVTGAVALGGYFDPRLGTILGVGEELLVIDDGEIRARIPLGERVVAIQPGDPGESALVLNLDEDRVLVVSLRGRKGVDDVVRLPDRSPSAPGGQLQFANVPGRDQIAVAGGDGKVTLVLISSGRQLRRRAIGPIGRIALAATPGRLLAGTGDGVLRVLDPETLRPLASRRVLADPIAALALAPAGRRVVLVSLGGEAVAIDLGHFVTVAHLGPVAGLGPAFIDPAEGRLWAGQSQSFTDGTSRSGLISWPLCVRCEAGVPALRAAARALTSVAAPDAVADFVPFGSGG